MFRFIIPAMAGSILALSACSPALNWREVPAGPDGGLKTLLPCKPDRTSRFQPLAGQNIELHMQGCEADGFLFAVSWADVKEGSLAGPALAQWQAAMLGAMQAATPQLQPFAVKGASAQPAAVRLSAGGKRPDGSAVQAQAVWFARGSQVFHAVVYGERISAEVGDTFFSAIEFHP